MLISFPVNFPVVIDGVEGDVTGLSLSITIPRPPPLTPDTTRPTVTSAEILESGNRLEIHCSESVLNHTGFSLVVTPSASLTYVSGEGTNVLTFSTSRTVYEEEVLGLLYSPGNVTDPTGNTLVTVGGGGLSVTNNSTAPPPPVTILSVHIDRSTVAITFSESVTGLADLTTIASVNINFDLHDIVYVSGDGSPVGIFTADPASAGDGEECSLNFSAILNGQSVEEFNFPVINDHP